MATVPHSYSTDTKIVRIPIKVKLAVDKAKPPGIELWKFTADVLLIGLAAIEQMKGTKEYERLTQYDVAELMQTPISEMFGKKKKA